MPAAESFGLSPAIPGKPFHLTDESGVRTWSPTVGPDGGLSRLRIFAEQGGERSRVDDRSNVHIAAGPIYVYNSFGQWIDTMEVPERPLQMFGGKDRRNLFIPARTSLYGPCQNQRAPRKRAGAFPKTFAMIRAQARCPK